MRRRLLKGLLLFALGSLLIAHCSLLLAAFEDTGTGARPTALGGAYVAVGDDAQSLMYNPAGLARLQYKEVTSEYSRLYLGLSDNSNLSQFYLGYGHPLKSGGAVAIGWKQFSLDSLYAERTLSLGYGRWISSRLAGGLALKQLYHSFGAPDMVVDSAGNIQSGTPSFFTDNGTSKSAYSADLGMLYRLTDRHTLGLSIQDVNEPNMALSSEDTDRVPRTIRLGLGYQGRRGLTLTGALTTRESLAGQRDYTYIGGLEKWWETAESGALAFRASIANGSREFRQMTTGFGYRVGSFQIDYAFIFNLSGMALGDTAGSHRFSLSYRFGVHAASAPVQTSVIVSSVTEPAEKPVPVESILQAPVSTGPVVGMPSRASLLLELSAAIQHYEELTHAKASVNDRLAAMEGVFDGLQTYSKGSQKDLLEAMAGQETLEDTYRNYMAARWSGANGGQRLESIVRALEKHLEPILRNRSWNFEDTSDQQYSRWLGQAWGYDHQLVAHRAGPVKRLSFLHRLVEKAIQFERHTIEQQ